MVRYGNISITKTQHRIEWVLKRLYRLLTGMPSFDVSLSDKSHIHLGKHIFIAPGVKIRTRNHNVYNIYEYNEHKDVYIGDYSWIAANAVILPGVKLGPHTIVAAGAVDIDGVICTNTWGNYEKAEPIPENINKVNELYQSGKVVLWTARGRLTGKDWRQLTERQLKKWGVKYHELRFDKPFYDVIIDDRGVNMDEL